MRQHHLTSIKEEPTVVQPPSDFLPSASSEPAARLPPKAVAAIYRHSSGGYDGVRMSPHADGVAGGVRMDNGVAGGVRMSPHGPDSGYMGSPQSGGSPVYTPTPSSTDSDQVSG